jgi:dihydrofolate synthase/folylpolyglutamate synthase
LLNVRLPGRFQILQTAIPTVVDVAHNPQSARVLAENLNAWPCSGKTYAIFSALRDKDISGTAAPLAQQVDEWHVFPLTSLRASNETELFLSLSKIPLRGLVYTHDSLEHARTEISVRATVNDRIVVFGSFYTVASFLHLVTSESAQHRIDSV